MPKSLCLLLMTIFISASLCGQNELDITADRYLLQVRNISQHSVYLTIKKKRKVVHEGLKSPSGFFSLRKYFTRNDLGKYSYSAKYNSQAYEADKKQLQSLKNSQLAKEKKNYEYLIRDNDEIFVYKVAAIYASNIKTNYDDNWLMKLSKGIARAFGKTYKTYRSFIEELPAIANIETEEDLAKYLFTRYAKYEIKIQEVMGEISRNEAITLEMLREFTAATLYYFDQLIIFDRKHESSISAINQSYNKNLTYLQDLVDSEAFEERNKGKVVRDSGNINWRTKTPAFSMSYSPAIYRLQINKYWKIGSDPLIIENPEEEDSYLFSDGWYNDLLFADFSIPISKEFGSKNNISRFYFSPYYMKSHLCLCDDNYILPRSVFEKAPTLGKQLTLQEQISLDLQNIGSFITFRSYLGSAVVLDINGGYNYNLKTIQFNKQPDSQEYTWKYNQLDIFEDTHSWLAGATLGLGLNSRGRYDRAGIIFYSSFLIEDLIFESRSLDFSILSAEGDNLLDFNSSNINYSLNFGLRISL